MGEGEERGRRGRRRMKNVIPGIRILSDEARKWQMICNAGLPMNVSLHQSAICRKCRQQEHIPGAGNVMLRREWCPQGFSTMYKSRMCNNLHGHSEFFPWMKCFASWSSSHNKFPHVRGPDSVRLPSSAVTATKMRTSFFVPA